MGIEENKALIRRLMDAIIEEHDLEILEELVSPDFVEHELNSGQEPGREGLRKWCATFLEAFPDTVWTLEAQLAEGEQVMSLYQWRGTHQARFAGIERTGRQVRSTSLFLDTIVGGRLAVRRSIHDGLGFLQQLGDIPPPGGVRPG